MRSWRLIIKNSNFPLPKGKKCRMETTRDACPFFAIARSTMCTSYFTPMSCLSHRYSCLNAKMGIFSHCQLPRSHSDFSRKLKKRLGGNVSSTRPTHCQTASMARTRRNLLTKICAIKVCAQPKKKCSTLRPKLNDF